MATAAASRLTRVLHWTLDRNPTYLLSAVAMALGAKLYLFAPNDRAGDVGLILLTLAALQFYEIAVSTILIALHACGRSLEDGPSLLIVAAIFWTGPLAATLELSELDGALGFGFALLAAVVALIEMRTVQRALDLRFSLFGQFAAAAGLLLLVEAPLRLRIAHGQGGTDELALYWFWWILAGIILLAIPAIRRNAAPPTNPFELNGTRNRLHLELAFIAAVVCAVACQLYAMNYAFFGHAVVSYGVPILAALALPAFEYLKLCGIRRRAALAGVAALPLIAIMLATQPLSEALTARLPAPLADPLVAALCLAAGAWWYGCVRNGAAVLVHAGSAALVAAFFRVVDVPEPASAAAYAGEPLMRLELALFAYALSAYLLLVGWVRRSKGEVGAALAAHVVAVALILNGRTAADTTIVCLLSGWTVLAALHLFCPRTPGWARCVVVGYLAVATSAAELLEPLRVLGWTHAAALTTILVMLGWRYPRTRYRTLGLIAGSICAATFLLGKIAGGSNPAAALTIVAAFVLLASGALVSWCKPNLRDLLNDPALSRRVWRK